MRINHNIAALNTYRQLTMNSVLQSKSLAKLSSGLRINSAADDAAGLAISEKMRAQIRGLEQAQRNAQDGISLIQTAEGALNEIHSILQRMRELAVQSASDTNTATDRAEIQKEVDQLAKEITRIANTTEFNTQNLLNGGIKTGYIGELTFHIGANANQNISLSINAMDAASLGVARDVTTYTGTTAGDIDTVEFDNIVGSKIVDGVTLSFTYSAGSSAQPATLTGGNYTLTTDLTGKTASITVTVDGTDYKINDLSTWKGSGDEAALISLLMNADTNGDGTGTKLSTVANVTGDGTKLTIETLSTGATSSISVTFGGADAALAETLFGISNGASATGSDAVSKNITISNGLGDSQVVTITDETATTFSVTSGDFAGISITTVSGKTLADLDGTDTVTISATTTSSTAATFSGGVKTADAVAAGGIDVSTQSAADAAVTIIQKAIETVSAERSKLGAYQNRLEHTINNLGTSAENLSASESRIRDVDMAKEMMEFTKMNILAQAAQAMLAQANQIPQGVLQLLR